MAAKQKAAPKGDEPTTQPVPDGHTAGWAHDWRNPDAKFSEDDHCVDAELARSDPTRR